MAQTASTISKLADLRLHGIRLAVDDFGTGYSSLGYLERFPIDTLKIDRTFVDGVGGRGNRPVLARAIIQLGRALGLEVVAEGIERPEQARALRRLGCGRGQGYLFARPAAPDEIEPLLAQGRVLLGSSRRRRARLLVRGSSREIA
jgi:EAL domain-containing protein (putative c-di-GMP-specific phosphodiesterase class I)